MPPRKPLASVEDLAEFLGVPVNTVYQWRSKGTGPRGARVGRHIRFRWENVERWLDEQEKAAPS